jgi:PAS domain S-box-containing protein
MPGQSKKTNSKFQPQIIETERFQKIFDLSPIGMVITGLNFKFLKVNSAACRIWGYPRKELLKMGFANITHPAERNRDISSVKKMMTGKIPYYQVKKRYIRKNGEVIWCNMHAFTIHDEFNRPLYFIAMVENINLLNKKEEELTDSEVKYRQLVENSPAGIIIAQGIPIKIVFANQAMANICGYNIKKLLSFRSREIWNLIHPLDRPEFIKKYLHRLAGNQKVPNDYLMHGIHKNGSIRTVMVHSSKISYSGQPAIQVIFTDITQKAEMEEKLKQNEEKFRLIYETSPDAIMTLEPPHWSFTAGNQAMVKMFGLKNKSEIHNLKPWMASPKYQPDGQLSVTKAKAMINLALKNGQNFFEWTHRTKSGKNFFATVLLTRIKGKKNNFLQARVNDITERKNTEKKINKLLTAVEQADEGIAITDLEGRINYANRAWIKMHGYHRLSDLIGKKMCFFHTSQEYQKRVEPFIKAVYKFGSHKGDVWHVKKNGQAFPTLMTATLLKDQAGQAFGIIGSATDISERLRKENLVKKDKAADEALLASLGEGVIAVNNTGRIIFSNPITDKYIGRAHSNIINQPWYKLFKVLDKNGRKIPKNKRPLSLAMKNKTAINTEISDGYQYLNDRQQIIPVNITIKPIIIGRETIGYINTFRNVSHEMEIDKLKTEFISLASHQLRTPITSINWNAEMLLAGDSGKINEQQKTEISEIYHSNHRMIDLINALLNISRLEMGKVLVERQAVNLEKIAKGALQDLKVMIKNKKLKITEKYYAGSKIFKGDPKLLDIIFQNLLSNATKYSFQNTKIKIETKKNKKELLIKVTNRGYRHS